jgi:hypothetical protein
MAKTKKCPFREYWAFSGLKKKEPICNYPHFTLSCPLIDIYKGIGDDVNCDSLTEEQLKVIRREGRLWL